jgi:predicted dinucleotide-binding enzyme
MSQQQQIAAIGAGNVGGTLGKPWAGYGHKVIGVGEPNARR